MTESKGCIAYIDGANLHKGSSSLSWKFDYKRFRIWLKDKYKVESAYIFIGLITKYTDLYASLEDAGFVLIFKEVTYDPRGKIKGNCDADLIVLAMQHFYEVSFDSMVLVSSDGDFAPLVKFMMKNNKMRAIVSPYTPENCSLLLKRSGAKIVYLSDQKTVLETPKNEKAPDRDETL